METRSSACDPQRSFAGAQDDRETLRMTERRSGWQRCAQDDSVSFCMTFGCSVLHVIRDALVVMLSEAKHLSHYSAHCHFSRFAQATLSIATESSYCSAPCHFARASHCHFDRAIPTVISTERSEWRNLPNRPAHCHFARAVYLCASLSFRPSGASGEICMLVVRGTVVGIYGLRRLQRRRCGDLDPEGLSSRLAVAF